MKIATFNVEFLFDEGEHRHSGKMWAYSKEYVAARVERLAKQISDIDADIMFLQEVASENMVKKIIEKTGKGYSYFLAQPDKLGVGNAVIFKSKDGVCESIPAISSFPVIVEGDADSIGPRLFSRRGFVHLATPYKGKTLHLFGLHLNARFFIHMRNADHSPIEAKTQLEAGDSLIRSEIFRSIQARAMRQAIDAIFAHDPQALIAVMGDFNSIERDTPFRIILGEFTTLDDSLISLGGRVPPERRHSFIGEHGPKLIDHILVSKALSSSVVSFDILNSDLAHHSNKPPAPTFIESDHAPLVAELS